MSAPIILWKSKPTTTTDDAGVTILNSVGPPRAYFRRGPYVADQATETNPPLRYIPPLSYFCIRHLVETPQIVHYYGPPRSSTAGHSVLRALMPSGLGADGRFDLKKVDPRLWAVIIQVYSDLPEDLRTYPAALSDEYVPLLQHVSASEHFSLLTVLDIPGCSHLDDDTILRLSPLHGLSVLDATGSHISAQGIRRLAGTLQWDEETPGNVSQRRGPWQLRILSLRNCKKVTNSVYQTLEAFPLLSAVDLRGTGCTWERGKMPSSFHSATEKRFFHPSHPLEALALLLSSPGLASSTNSYFLHINRLTYASPTHRLGSVQILDKQNSVALPENTHAAMSTLGTHSLGPDFAPNNPRLQTSGGPLGLVPDRETDILTAMNDVAASESDARTAHHRASMFYSHMPSRNGPLRTRQSKDMPKWGQELLMLYREPPPWSRVQGPPVGKLQKKPRVPEEALVKASRGTERARKGIQELQHMLSRRQPPERTETNTSLDGAKAPSGLPTLKNPFSKPTECSITHHYTEVNDADPPHTSTAARNVMAAPPRSSGVLKPITSLPVPIPPPAGKLSEKTEKPPKAWQESIGQRSSHELDVECRRTTLQSNERRSEERGVSTAAAKTSTRSIDQRRPTSTASTPARKKQKSVSASGGFDWSGWSGRR
ncbi:hypothetical protein BC834DRAFT_218501 [Gloeopeniophorella convolvens]|nr:hypothetical protein BC834DRAFT_218501 [Gloeopeniophorella convolvens]